MSNVEPINRTTTEEESLNSYVFPVEFISMEKRNSNIQESILLTCIQQLISLPWPTCPKAPASIDIGSSIEIFIRNLVAKHKLDNMGCQTLTNNTSEIVNTTPSSNLDYNQFLQLLQSVINKAPST